MGKKFTRLLVAIFLVVNCILDETAAIAESAQQAVMPHHHRAFWLWPGVTLPPDLQIDRLYLLQRTFRSYNGNAIATNYYHYPFRLKKIRELVLVYRLESLINPDVVMHSINRDITAWQEVGNHVIGFQVDFDSGTRALDNYDQFLKKINQLNHKKFLFSVTGLLDWGNAKSIDIKSVSNTVDEIIFQTYQGKQTIVQYAQYLEKISQLDIPFQVGLVSSGNFSDKVIEKLKTNENFKGFVVFLLKNE